MAKGLESKLFEDLNLEHSTLSKVSEHFIVYHFSLIACVDHNVHALLTYNTWMFPEFTKKLPVLWNFVSRLNLGQFKIWRSPIVFIHFSGGSPLWDFFFLFMTKTDFCSFLIFNGRVTGERAAVHVVRGREIERVCYASEYGRDCVCGPSTHTHTHTHTHLHDE